jgi:hypothetical protein
MTIDAAAVTLAKMADMATASFIGRNTAATGVPEVLSAATARGILNVADGSTANAGTVTSVATAGTVSGITLTGTVTSTGTLTLGGTLAADLTTDVTGILPGANGGTGNGFTAVTGPTTSLKTFTLPDASATILTDNAAVTVAQGGTGQTSYTNGQLLIGNTTGNTLTKATLTGGTGITITDGTGSIQIDADNNGTVTSVGTTGTVNGLTLTGTVTTTGNLTLGGTLAISNADWSGTDLSVANGGTGASTLTGVLIGNGASAFTAVTAPSGAIVGTTDTQTLTGKTITTVGVLITEATDASESGLRVPHGTAPSAPVNGDIWSTTAGFYGRVNGVTVGPFIDTGVSYPLLADDGAVGAPSFSFSGDTDTGMWRAATPSLEFSVSGASRFGIGVASVATSVPFSVPDGTAGAPSYTFNSDTDTGLWHSATANTINFSTFGVERLEISTTAITPALPILAPGGSEAAPSYAFGSDVGMWSTAGRLKFSVGGTEELEIDSGVLNVAGTLNVLTQLNIDQGNIPASDSATGNAGDVSWDATDLYVCVATDTWGKISLTLTF